MWLLSLKSGLAGRSVALDRFSIRSLRSLISIVMNCHRTVPFTPNIVTAVILAFFAFSLTGHPAASKQGAELLKVDVMAVLAHPDDETGMATALASLALKDGKTVANIYCTRGEGGGNMVGTHWGPSLGVLREAELRDCLAGLGVRYCFFLEQRDWAYTESMAATLRAWKKDVALGKLVRYIRALRPEVVLTMNPTPNPGQHGHHQSAAILATEAFVAAADPERFPDQLTKEGLRVWQARKLYSSGKFGNHGVEISGAEEVAGLALGTIAGKALSNHRSQGFGRMLGAPWLNRARWFSLIKSVTEFRREKTFFDGLPVQEAVPVLLKAPNGQKSEKPLSLSARLVPRPAITRYESWIKKMGVEQIAMEFMPDIPVVLGEQNDVLVEVVNPFDRPISGNVELEGDGELSLKPASVRRSFPPGKTNLSFVVIPRQLSDFSVKVRMQSEGRELLSAAVLHTVPSAFVVAEDALPAIDSPRWEKLPTLQIGASQRVQGTISNEDDSRAEVTLTHDREALAVLVRVWDDVVVSNILDGDVRGHWRSDSVEICIDPDGGAEDSFSSFKIGVFPFIENLGARAARDADANQGPIEETAPGTRVSSLRLDDGYLIRATIPFHEAGIEVGDEGWIGFNVIVYDGDKADAEIGENINESRIAWSARSGVQGRPEDWGRIRLQ